MTGEEREALIARESTARRGAAWGRQIGRARESGLYTPETWLRIYAAHAHGHAGQIRRLREALAR